MAAGMQWQWWIVPADFVGSCWQHGQFTLWLWSLQSTPYVYEIVYWTIPIGNRYFPGNHPEISSWTAYDMCMKFWKSSLLTAKSSFWYMFITSFFIGHGFHSYEKSRLNPDTSAIWGTGRMRLKLADLGTFERPSLPVSTRPATQLGRWVGWEDDLCFVDVYGSIIAGYNWAIFGEMLVNSSEMEHLGMGLVMKIGMKIMGL